MRSKTSAANLVDTIIPSTRCLRATPTTSSRPASDRSGAILSSTGTGPLLVEDLTVTGGGSGIGREVALAFAKAGARVLVLPTVPFGVQSGQLDVPFCLHVQPSTQLALLAEEGPPPAGPPAEPAAREALRYL